jgi:hypothetical protein
LQPCHDIAAEVQGCLRENPDARVAVLPQGPLTIPYLRDVVTGDRHFEQAGFNALLKS